MQATGRAVVYEGHREPPNVFRIVEYPRPEPEPGGVLVEMTMANICGSDMHGYLGEAAYRSITRPRHLGHEGIGRVAALGEGVTTDSNGTPLGPGDRVVFGHFYPCGRCRACVAGKDWCCPRRRDHMEVSSEEWPHFRGTFGDYHYLFARHTIFKAPDELSDEVVAPVNCAMTQVYCGFELAALTVGEDVVIQGAGGLGIYAIAVARERGAGKVIVIDGVRERLDLAAEFGADELIDLRESPTPEQRIRRVKELTGGWGADVVMEVVGYPAVVEEGIRMVGSGGRFVEIGCRAPHLSYAAVPEQWVTGNVTIIGNNNYGRRHLSGALDLLRRTRNKYPYHKVLSHQFPLEQVNEAFAQQHRGHVTRACLVV
jgi:threonine dehydrogenase-like Zn-dependent dehydrogenase